MILKILLDSPICPHLIWKLFGAVAIGMVAQTVVNEPQKIASSSNLYFFISYDVWSSLYSYMAELDFILRQQEKTRPHGFSFKDPQVSGIQLPYARVENNNIWKEWRLNPGQLALKAITLTTRPCPYTLEMHFFTNPWAYTIFTHRWHG